MNKKKIVMKWKKFKMNWQRNKGDLLVLWPTIVLWYHYIQARRIVWYTNFKTNRSEFDTQPSHVKHMAWRTLRLEKADALYRKAIKDAALLTKPRLTVRIIADFVDYLLKFTSNKNRYYEAERLMNQAFQICSEDLYTDDLFTKDSLISRIRISLEDIQTYFLQEAKHFIYESLDARRSPDRGIEDAESLIESAFDMIEEHYGIEHWTYAALLIELAQPIYVGSQRGARLLARAQQIADEWPNALNGNLTYMIEYNKTQFRIEDAKRDYGFGDDWEVLP